MSVASAGNLSSTCHLIASHEIPSEIGFSSDGLLAMTAC